MLKVSKTLKGELFEESLITQLKKAYYMSEKTKHKIIHILLKIL